MTNPVPEPGSPEALAAVRKVKNIFLIIVAVNIAVIAIVLGPKLFTKPEASPDQQAAPAASAKPQEQSAP